VLRLPVVDDSTQSAGLLSCVNNESADYRPIPVVDLSNSDCRRRCRGSLQHRKPNYPGDHRNSCLRNIVLEEFRLPSILLSNVCHLSNKLDDLSVLTKLHHPDIICVTETWLNPNIPDTAINLEGYDIIRKDRLISSGGGVAVFLSYRELSVVNVDNFEVLWILLRPRQLPRPLSCLLVAVVYCPPNYDASTMKKLASFIVSSCGTLLRDYPDAGIFISGDFNSLHTNQFNKYFNFSQIVTLPTRKI